MKRLPAPIACTVAIAAIVSAPVVLHAQSGAAPACRIAITTPGDEDQVGRRAAVRGTAATPEGAVLWVLVHRTDLVDQWWPQGAAVADDQSRWMLTAEFGRSRDVGHAFAITAVAVNADTHRRLLDWFSTAAAREYPPVPFPHTVDRCATATVRVRKISH